MKNDTAYDNRSFIPGAGEFPDRWAEEARAFREIEAAVGRARLNARYGDHDREAFDLFHPAGRPEGLVVFVHGGYWRLFDRSYWSHFAAGCTARGWAVAVPSYPLAPDRRIADITRSVARAIAAAAGYVAGPIALAGHSAGGHLVARMIAEDLPLTPDIGERIIRVAPISPVGDLRPLVDTSMNADFGLTEETAAVESPTLVGKGLDVPVTVWVGAAERPAFIDQARRLSEAWSAELEIVPDRHHFDVIDALRDPESAMVTSIVG